MKITVEQLKNHLVEIYTYHFKKARALHKADEIKSIEQAYELGQHDGATNTVGAILLLCFGGKETFDIWEMTRKWCEEEEDE